MRRLPLVLLLAALLAPGRGVAQGIDLSSGGPVQVTASGGFEWRESQQEVIATGEARAVRGDVTVLADELIAYYRKKAAAAQPASTAVPQAAGPATSSPATPGIDASTGGNEIYRLEAVGHVRIVTPTDEAVGDHAIYDIDQAVLVMTGHALRLTTPQYVLTARDSLEYWSQQHMAVARGDALAVATDGRRLKADVLVAYTTEGATTSQAAAHPAPPAAGTGLENSTGRLERLEGFGNVSVVTQADTVYGDRGVYVPATGDAFVFGSVRITHGDSVMTGAAADVNMKTGIAHVIANPEGRVQGLIQPNDAQGQVGGQSAAAPARPGAPAR